MIFIEEIRILFSLVLPRDLTIVDRFYVTGYSVCVSVSNGGDSLVGA